MVETENLSAVYKGLPCPKGPRYRHGDMSENMVVIPNIETLLYTYFGPFALGLVDVVRRMFGVWGCKGSTQSSSARGESSVLRETAYGSHEGSEVPM